MKPCIILLVFLLLLDSFPLLAETRKDGNELLKSCNLVVATMSEKSISLNALDFKDTVRMARCIGYIDGFTNAVRMNKATNKFDLFNICLPDVAVPVDQTARIIVKYLEDNPNILHKMDTVGIMYALQDAFPCN